MPIRLLGIAGSIRKDSYNLAVLRTLREGLRHPVSLEIFPLDDVPLYNQDHDIEAAPPPVRDLRRAIRAADGLVISSPEYIHGVPGVLKNALDWASRPYGSAALVGKPVLTVTASPASTGGVRAHAQLNEALAATAARVVLRPQTVIGAVHEKVVDGRIVDELSTAFLAQGLEDLLGDIRTLRRHETAEVAHALA